MDKLTDTLSETKILNNKTQLLNNKIYSLEREIEKLTDLNTDLKVFARQKELELQKTQYELE